jgi:hypothetical protein
MKSSRIALFFLLMTMAYGSSSHSQELTPRAYVWVPKNTTTLISGLNFSEGDIVTDATLPVKDVSAEVQSLTIGVSHNFALKGLTSQILVLVPYAWARVSGELNEAAAEVNRSGFSDMRLRFSVLFLNAPAATLKEIVTAPRKTILGASLNITAPTGQFYSDKLINLGTNRWSFFPELAVSQPISKKWLLDFYSGIWFFTDNTHFFPGDAVRSQKPMGSFQAHLSYNITPVFWVAINSTYYVGGNSSINGVINDDRANNSRLGLTAVIPTGKLSAIKVTANTGAVVRVGQDFNTFSIGWQKSWLEKPKKPIVE